MPRRIKKGSAVFQYLEATGLFESGNADEIKAAKKMYWASVRKAWKSEHRREHKSYTIFFSGKEQRLLELASSRTNTSITSFIKSTCIHTLTSTPNIDKKIIGKIRELLVLFHNDLQHFNQNSDNQIHRVIDVYSNLENDILSLLLHTKSVIRVD